MSNDANRADRYVRRGYLAEYLDVHVSTVDRLRRAGMPSVVWGDRSRRFLLSEVEAWGKSNEIELGGEVVSLKERRRRVQ